MSRPIFTPRHARLCTLLVQARKRARLTQAAVATRLNRPQSFVAKYEGGHRRLDVIEFLDVARAIGVSPRRLLAELERLS